MPFTALPSGWVTLWLPAWLICVLVPIWFGPLDPGSGLQLLGLATAGVLGCRWWTGRGLVVGMLLLLLTSQAIEQQLASRYSGPPRLLAGAFDVIAVSQQAGWAADGGPEPARFEVLLRWPAAALDADWIGRRLRVSWFPAQHRSAVPPPLAAGQRYQLRLRVREPWGRVNGAGFDYERWLLSRRIDATAVVRGGRLWVDATNGLAAVRRSAGGALAGLARGPWLRALLLGDRSSLGPEDWDLLQRTGTVHLLVVSGLHISLVAALGFGLGRGAGRCCGLLHPRLAPSLFGLLVALAASGAYVLLSGSGIPAQRAWFMSNAALIGLSYGRGWRTEQVLLCALLLVLLLDPLAGLGAGLWLSFAAVALLLLWFNPRRERGRSRFSGMLQLGEAQLVVSLGLLPVFSVLGAPIALAGPLANLIAVPVISVLVVPLGLLAVLLTAIAPKLALIAFTVLDGLLGWLLRWFELLAVLPVFEAPVPRGAALVAIAGLLIIRWRPTQHRHWLVPVLGAVAVHLLPPQRPALGEFTVTVFDVGQGDAVLVQTQRRVLLFDSGPAFGSSANRTDSAESTILPVLRARRLNRLDALVISHDDLDHAGGERRLLQRFEPPAHWRGRADGEFPASQGCRRGQQFHWDGVRFEFLHPWRSTADDGSNTQSCVLHISNASGTASVLLPGDIDRAAERELLTGRLTPVSLLLMPHHGSRTSSSMVLVRRLQPLLAVASAPREGRFGHPHADVLARYRSVGSDLFVTGWTGALHWRSERPRQLRAERCANGYWSGRPQPDRCGAVSETASWFPESQRPLSGGGPVPPCHRRSENCRSPSLRSGSAARPSADAHDSAAGSRRSE